MSADGMNGTGGFVDAEQWLARKSAAPPAHHLPTPNQDPRQPRPTDAVDQEQVAKAVAYARRSTREAPKSEQRLREALARRNLSEAVIDSALARCREEGVVDDMGLARALAEEGLRKGHAPRRIQQSLETRGLPEEVVGEVLADFSYSDEEAAAYALAAERAARLRATEPEVAFRRIVGFLARRGYAEMTARKVARQAVFNDREGQRSAER